MIFVSRMLPGIRTLINIPAGMSRIPFHKFFLATFAGAYIWCTVLIGAGYVLGHEWKLISEFISTHLPLVFAIGFVLVAGFLVYHYRASISLPRWTRQRNKELD
jgi:membrane protein DedA with SNARE-associated domain